MYIHASREMTAHLTRQTLSALPMFTKKREMQGNNSKITNYIKLWYSKLRQSKRSLPRKARSHGEICNQKRIMTIHHMYVHAMREMAAHLTRCAYAHPADVR